MKISHEVPDHSGAKIGHEALGRFQGPKSVIIRTISRLGCASILLVPLLLYCSTVV